MTVSLPRRRRRSAIDVSLAIVNIVLLLLFFFLVTGQIAADDRVDGLELSQTTNLPLDQLPRPILIVQPNGEWVLNDREVAPDLLGVALDALPQPVTLNLLIDRAAPGSELVALLNNPDLAERGVRLVTLRRRGSQ